MRNKSTKVLQAQYKNKLTLQYIQHNLHINYLIYKCNLWSVHKYFGGGAGQNGGGPKKF